MTILFDLDGTLIDSTEAILESFHKACEAFGFPRVSDAEITKLIGYPLDIMFASVGVDEAKVWDYVVQYKKNYRIISKQKTVLLPKAKETIELAATFARLGVVTTKTARYSEELLEHFGAMHHFETLIGRENVKHPKPHSEPIEKALESMGIKSKEDVYIVGDTKLDLESAKNAGIEALGVLCGYGEKCELDRYGFALFTDAFAAVEHLKNKAQKEKNQHTLS